MKGINWNVGAVGNATWTGARLYDVLRDLGINEDAFDHVQVSYLIKNSPIFIEMLLLSSTNIIMLIFFRFLLLKYLHLFDQVYIIVGIYCILINNP